MPWQLIYTSAPRLLTAGQTGFGTVARHREVPLLVVSAVERATQFARLPGMDAGRVVFSHRILDGAGCRYHVLTRIASAGADYTGRTNHLAHHVIVTAAEAAVLAAQRVSAGDVVLRFPWRSSWEEGARWLNDDETPDLAALPIGPSERLSAWMEATGNALHANHLVTGPGARNGCVVITPAAFETRRLFAESLRALPEQGWHFTFTTELDPGDTMGDFRWIGCSADSPLLKSLQTGRRLGLDLTRLDSLPAAEALPEKPAPAASSAAAKPAVPPRVPVPVGDVFVEPEVELPPPDAPWAGPIAVPPPAPPRARRKTSTDRHHDHLSWRAIAGMVLASVALLTIVVQLSGSWKPSKSREDPPAAAPEHTIEAPEIEIGELKPEPAPAGGAVTVTPAPPQPAPPAITPAPEAPARSVIPWRAAHASQLGTLPLPELRLQQTHLLVTSRGEERGPLFEVRNNLSLSLREPSPVLRLDYAAHRAVWSAAPESAAAPPVQWRILHDNHEILRVLIGDGTQETPIEASPVPATQDEGGVIGGAFAGYLQRFRDQATWLRPSSAVLMVLRECGYAGAPFVPLRDLKADTSELLEWLAKEQAKMETKVNAPTFSPNFPAGTAVATENEEKRSAPRSKQTNTLQNRPPPTSSIAGTMEQAQQQTRAIAQKRLEKLAALGKGGLMLGRFGPGTCSFFAGPPACTPQDAVWICDVVFATP